jgi:hypothetical protein
MCVCWLKRSLCLYYFWSLLLSHHPIIISNLCLYVYLQWLGSLQVSALTILWLHYDYIVSALEKQKAYSGEMAKWREIWYIMKYRESWLLLLSRRNENLRKWLTSYIVGIHAAWLSPSEDIWEMASMQWLQKRKLKCILCNAGWEVCLAQCMQPVYFLATWPVSMQPGSWPSKTAEEKSICLAILWKCYLLSII